MFEALDTLLARKNQRFVCENGGWPAPAPEPHVALLRHDVTPALTPAEMATLQEQLGDLPEVKAFYSRWGSVRLYCDTVYREPIGFASAFLIAHPDTWQDLRERFDGWLENLDESERDELLPAWINDVAVIGEVPNSGNYFLMPLTGEERGRIVEFEHDGFEFIERAANLDEFVTTLCTVNEALLWEILGHTRYADGSTPSQWMCKEYLFDE